MPVGSSNGPWVCLGTNSAECIGLALFTAGVFVTDPSLGYPPGTHSSGPQTLHGTIHGVAGLIAFISVAIASFVIARRFAGDPEWKGWALDPTVTGILVESSSLPLPQCLPSTKLASCETRQPACCSVLRLSLAGVGLPSWRFGF